MTAYTFLALVVLVLAGHRFSRIIGWDSITRSFRERQLGWSDNGKPMPGERAKTRKKVAEFVHCPWCQGFWISVVLWVCYRHWPQGTLLVCTPFAISSAIGVYTTNLDA